MGLLSQVMADDMAAFLDTDGFAESVIYVPVSGPSRTIHAIVDRDPPVNHDSGLRPKIRFTVANNSTTGISTAELNTGGDKISTTYRGASVTWAIRRSSDVDGEDSAALHLELE